MIYLMDCLQFQLHLNLPLPYRSYTIKINKTERKNKFDMKFITFYTVCSNIVFFFFFFFYFPFISLIALSGVEFSMDCIQA